MKIQSYLVIVLLFYFQGEADAVAQQILTHDLATHLFHNYSAFLRPNCPGEHTVDMKLDIALRQIMELNEREQILTTNVWVRLAWNDCRLKWDISDFNNVTSFAATYDDVWIPDITLYDSAAEEEMMPGRPDYRAYILNDGTVYYNFPTVIKSVCRVDVRYFPFDKQRCYLKFGSWSHHGFQLDVTNKNPYGDLDVYVANNEWVIEALPAKKSVLYYNCCPEPYPDVAYYIVMRRRPAFYLLTMVFPCMITTVVAAVGFILPVESGEKVSLNITVLLSMAVFLLVVSESMPPSSDNFPIIGLYFATSMALVSSSCLLTVIILNVFYRGTNGRKVPRILRIIFFQYLGRYLCVLHNKIADEDEEYHELNETISRIHVQLPDEAKQSQCQADSSSGSDSAHPNALQAQLDVTNKYMKHMDNLVHEKRREALINAEWRDFANICDRVFLIVYLFILIVSTLGLLLQCVAQ